MECDNLRNKVCNDVDVTLSSDFVSGIFFTNRSATNDEDDQLETKRFNIFGSRFTNFFGCESAINVS